MVGGTGNGLASAGELMPAMVVVATTLTAMETNAPGNVDEIPYLYLMKIDGSGQRPEVCEVLDILAGSAC